MNPSNTYSYWKVMKLKRLVRSASNSSSRPLATLWRNNHKQFAGIPINVQLSVVSSWAEDIYGKEASIRLGLVERTEALMARSRVIYQNHQVDMDTSPVAIVDPLRIVMAELSY